MFKLKQIVFHVADDLQEPGIICGIVNRPNNTTTYLVGKKDGERECYEFELTNDKIIF